MEFWGLRHSSETIAPHHCRDWKKMKTEEKARKTGLDTQLKKAQLAQLDKRKNNNLMLAVTPAALQQQPPPAPASQFTQALSSLLNHMGTHNHTYPHRDNHWCAGIAE
jgi:hypothetical protein